MPLRVKILMLESLVLTSVTMDIQLRGWQHVRVIVIAALYLLLNVDQTEVLRVRGGACCCRCLLALVFVPGVCRRRFACNAAIVINSRV